MSEKDGGPAFPVMTERTALSNNDNYVTVREPEGGMSLRDYFAGEALKGYLSSPGSVGIDARDNPDHAAEWSYDQADAMLKERAK